MISVGNKLPALDGFVMGASGPTKINLSTLSNKKKIIILGIPAAFSGVCSKKHLPNYLENYDKFREKGIDTIICLSVNDVFVMDAFGKSIDVSGRIVMLADADASISKSLNITFDMEALNMGLRAKRFVLYANDSVVEYFAHEEVASDYINTKAELLLKSLAK